MRTVTLMHGRSEDAGVNVPITKENILSMKRYIVENNARLHLITGVFSNRRQRNQNFRALMEQNKINNRKLTYSRVISRQKKGFLMLPKGVMNFLESVGRKARILFLRSQKS